VIDVAGSATVTTRRLLQLVEDDRRRVHALGRASGSASRLHELVVREIGISIPWAAQHLGLSEPTVSKATKHLEDLGILREVTGRARGKIFLYNDYLAILNEGTEVSRT
jgi:Fic family protein